MMLNFRKKTPEHLYLWKSPWTFDALKSTNTAYCWPSSKDITHSYDSMFLSLELQITLTTLFVF